MFVGGDAVGCARVLEDLAPFGVWSVLEGGTYWSEWARCGYVDDRSDMEGGQAPQECFLLFDVADGWAGAVVDLAGDEVAEFIGVEVEQFADVSVHDRRRGDVPSVGRHLLGHDHDQAGEQIGQRVNAMPVDGGGDIDIRFCPVGDRVEHRPAHRVDHCELRCKVAELVTHQGWPPFLRWP